MAVDTDITTKLPPEVASVYSQIDGVRAKVLQTASLAEELTRPYEKCLEDIKSLSDQDLQRAYHEPFDYEQLVFLGRALARQRHHLSVAIPLTVLNYLEELSKRAWNSDQNQDLDLIETVRRIPFNDKLVSLCNSQGLGRRFRVGLQIKEANSVNEFIEQGRDRGITLLTQALNQDGQPKLLYGRSLGNGRRQLKVKSTGGGLAAYVRTAVSTVMGVYAWENPEVLKAEGKDPELQISTLSFRIFSPITLDLMSK